MPVYSDADFLNTFIPQEDCVAVQDVATEQSAVLEVKAKGDFTAISQVKAENNDAAPVYDLTGRRLSAVPQKGMYIQNGRKMMAR